MTIQRIIPTSMATQHPDNVRKPYWSNTPFISTRMEIQEAYRCFKEFGIDEYNWDWEGKFVDEAVVDRLLHLHFSYFKKNILGKEKFLTFRIPNPNIEKQFRLARAFMVAVTSSQLSQSLGFDTAPIFEMILPLTETAKDILNIQEAFSKLIKIEHELLKMEDSIQKIEIIPLFEQVDTIRRSSDILRTYIHMYKDMFGKTPAYLRPYCARSDPALNSGLVPTMFALKSALSMYAKLETELNIPLYPIVGTGVLPFRGGVSPLRTHEVLEEYAGVKTLVLQSAFRYDFPRPTVKKAVADIKTMLPKTKAIKVTKEQDDILSKVIEVFQTPYRETIEKLAPIINTISLQVPKRRERLQHIGLFGYSRGIGSVSLPRAIPFTGALYSIGLPPEIIGTGRGIIHARKLGLWNEVCDLYRHRLQDFAFAARYVNRNVVLELSKIIPGIVDDIKAIEEEMGSPVGPKTDEQKEYETLSYKAWKKYSDGQDISELITKMGLIRQSIG